LVVAVAERYGADEVGIGAVVVAVVELVRAIPILLVDMGCLVPVGFDHAAWVDAAPNEVVQPDAGGIAEQRRAGGLAAADDEASLTPNERLPGATRLFGSVLHTGRIGGL